MVVFGITFVSTRAHILQPIKQQRGSQLLHSRNNGDITQFNALDCPFIKKRLRGANRAGVLLKDAQALL
jgi:hypothetical protein